MKINSIQLQFYHNIYTLLETKIQLTLRPGPPIDPGCPGSPASPSAPLMPFSPWDPFAPASP